MQKKKIILELSCELIEEIDRLNTIGDRSDFVSYLLEEKLKSKISGNPEIKDEFLTRMGKNQDIIKISGEIDLVDSKGISLGKFDIDTLEGFEELTRKVQEISKDPAVQIRASSLF